MVTSPSSSKKGATLLIAVFMASIMLSVGLGVYQRTYKELYFSSFWKHAQLAFGAADTGLECALFFDLHPPVGKVHFATSPSSAIPSPLNQISCGPGAINNITIPSALFGTVGIYQYATSTISLATPYSFSVEVVKTTNTISGITTTKIISRGYNDSNTASLRRVERGLRIDY